MPVEHAYPDVPIKPMSARTNTLVTLSMQNDIIEEN